MPLSEVVIIVARLLIGNSVLNCFHKLLFYCIMHNKDAIFLGEDMGSWDEKQAVWVGTMPFLKTRLSLFSTLLCILLLNYIICYCCTPKSTTSLHIFVGGEVICWLKTWNVSNQHVFLNKILLHCTAQSECFGVPVQLDDIIIITAWCK